MALVDWSSAEQCEWWDGATNTSSIPLVRPGSNIMLRLLTLTFSQPGYRLLMLTETADQRGAVKSCTGQCAYLLSFPSFAYVFVLFRDALSPLDSCFRWDCVCAPCVVLCSYFPRNVVLVLFASPPRSLSCALCARRG